MVHTLCNQEHAKFKLNSKTLRKDVYSLQFQEMDKCCQGCQTWRHSTYINLNIDSIQTITAECKTNKEQETCTSIEDCTNKNTTRDEGCKNNTSEDNKQNTNGHYHPCNKYTSINYFHSSNNIDADKRSSSAMMQNIPHKVW